MRGNCWFQKGFTLVELLVVMSIIALLIGILLPSLSRVRQTAREAACKQNLRQIGIAVAGYSLDHRGRMPDAGQNEDGERDLATNGLAPYFTDQYTLEGVLASREFVWLCPTHDFKWNGEMTSSYGYNVQYMLQADADGSYPHTGWGGFGNPGIPTESIYQPSRKLVIVDQDVPSGNTSMWSYVARPGDGSPVNGFGQIDLRHGNETANVLFADSHVSAEDEDFADAAEESDHWDPR